VATDEVREPSWSHASNSPLSSEGREPERLDPTKNIPVTKTPDQKARPRGTDQVTIDTHKIAISQYDKSNGRDSGFALARPVLWSSRSRTPDCDRKSQRIEGRPRLRSGRRTRVKPLGRRRRASAGAGTARPTKNIRPDEEPPYLGGMTGPGDLRYFSASSARRASCRASRAISSILSSTLTSSVDSVRSGMVYFRSAILAPIFSSVV
jgi:hypothetical protein